MWFYSSTNEGCNVLTYLFVKEFFKRTPEKWAPRPYALDPSLLNTCPTLLHVAGQLATKIHRTLARMNEERPEVIFANGDLGQMLSSQVAAGYWYNQHGSGVRWCASDNSSRLQGAPLAGRRVAIVAIDINRDSVKQSVDLVRQAGGEALLVATIFDHEESAPGADLPLSTALVTELKVPVTSLCGAGDLLSCLGERDQEWHRALLAHLNSL